MKFIYKQAILPNDIVLAQRIETAAADLYNRLMLLDYKNLPISEYTKTYYEDYLRKLKYSLQACSFIVFWSVKIAGKPLEELTFLDNGGGTGILSLLAKQVGIKTVIYNDIYDVSTTDAATIAKALNIPVDDFITGDIDEVINYFKASGRLCDIVASRNVIEHIYNLDFYFQQLAMLNTGSLTLFFATTANMYNPLTNLYTKRLQNKREYVDRVMQTGDKERDQFLAYLKIREKLITDQAAQLSNSEIKELAIKTRGLAKEDINKAVNEYLETGNYPEEMKHPTNTCDPLTGNWSEHLVEKEKYEKLFRKNEFDFEIINGFYNTNYQKKYLNLVTPLLNFSIKHLPFTGIYLAPFIALAGKSKKA